MKAYFVDEYLTGYLQEEISNGGILDLANKLTDLTMVVNGSQQQSTSSLSALATQYLQHYNEGSNHRDISS